MTAWRMCIWNDWAAVRAATNSETNHLQFTTPLYFSIQHCYAVICITTFNIMTKVLWKMSALTDIILSHATKCTGPDWLKVT